MRIYLQTISNIACVVNIANITLHKYGLIVLLRILLCDQIYFQTISNILYVLNITLHKYGLIVLLRILLRDADLFSDDI